MGAPLQRGRMAIVSPFAGTISGTLIASSGAPAVGYRVVAVEAHSYSIFGRSATDASGAYTIGGLNKALTYNVVFEDYDDGAGAQYDYLILSRVTPG